jgi:hypothetical protein
MTTKRPEKRPSGEHIIERVDASTWRGEGLEAFLDGIDRDAVCEKCGGLPYDIVFSYNGAQYKFCLYKIQKDGKILVETDYEMLYEYTKKGGQMMDNRHKKIISGAPAGI